MSTVAKLELLAAAAHALELAVREAAWEFARHGALSSAAAERVTATGIVLVDALAEVRRDGELS